MSILEFQMTAGAFLALQRNTLRAQKVCPPAPVTAGGVQIVVDRFEFGANALRHDVPVSQIPVFYQEGEELAAVKNTASGFRTQVAQDVTAYVTTMGEVMAHPNGVPTLVPIRGTVVVDFDLVVTGTGDVWLQAAFNRLEPAPLALPVPLPVDPSALVNAVNAQLATVIPRQSSPLGMAGMLPKGVLFTNAGISVDGQGQRIAMRIEIGGRNLNNDVPWTNFLTGFIPDRLQGLDWSLFVEAGYIEETAKALVNQGLASAGTIDHLQTFVGCDYSNAGGKAVFTLDVLGIYDLPDPLGAAELEPRVPIEVRVEGPGVLTVDADFSSEVNAIMSFIDLIDGLLPSFARALRGFVSGLIQTALTEGAAAVEDAAPVDDTKVVGNHIVATLTIPVWSAVSAGTARLTTVLSLEEGPALAGTLRVPELAYGTLQTAVREFGWNPPSIHCGAASVALVAAFSDNPSGWALLHGEGFLQYDGSVPAFICSTTVVADPLGVFPAARIRADSGQLNAALRLDMPVPGAAYYNLPLQAPAQFPNRYSCDVLAKTTAGIRLLRFAPPPELGRADVDRLTAELLAKIASCESLVGGWLHGHGYNPQWSVDPPPGGRVVDHLWQVQVDGLEAGERVSLIDARGQEIVRGTARAGVAMRLSAFVAPEAERELTVLRTMSAPGRTTAPDATGGEQPPDGGRATGLAVGQRLLLRAGRIALAERCRSVQASPVFSTRGLVAILEDAIAAFDMSNPASPALDGMWPVRGARGVLNLGRTLLAYGDSGLTAIDGTSRVMASNRRLDARASIVGCLGRIVSAAVSGDSLYALTGETIDVFDQGVCKRGEIASGGARGIAVTDGWLVAGGPDGASAYRVDGLRRELEWRGGRIQSVCRPLGAPAGTVLAALENRSAVLLAIGARGFEEIASYPRVPWFASAARVGSLLVTIGRGGRWLELRRFGEARAI
jgi:hypothetical protein